MSSPLNLTDAIITIPDTGTSIKRQVGFNAWPETDTAFKEPGSMEFVLYYEFGSMDFLETNYMYTQI